MRIVVLGASGIQGRHQVHHLARSGHTVIAISRTHKPLPEDIQPDLVEHVSASFTDTQTLRTAFLGADRIFINLPSTSFNPSDPILSAAKTIADLAKECGVPMMVFNTSMPIPLIPQGIKAQDDRRLIRTILRSTGVPVISIEPVVYLDNLLEGWALPMIRDEKRLVYCHKSGLRVSWICHYDVARIMSAASLRLDLAGRDIPVGGPETVVLKELAAKLSRMWGVTLSYENQSVADFCEKISENMKGRGLESDRIVSQMFKAYTYYNEAEDEPFHVDMSGIAEELGVELTSIEEWAGRRSAWDDKGYF